VQKSTAISAAPSLEREPRWPAILGLLAVGFLNLAIPERLSLGPRWLILIVIILLLIPTTFSLQRGMMRLNFVLSTSISAVITITLIWSLAFLIAGIPDKRESPLEMLRGAAALWASNILVFASWYWRLDAGGPHLRDLREDHTEGAFLFPQMTSYKSNASHKFWKPGFVDYLFLAFNASTAFSPADTPVLSRWAKLLMMTQSCISLGTIAILAARAIGDF
jgi:hypothetical protein